MMRAIVRLLICITALLIIRVPAAAQEKEKLFIDSLDNAFDMSKWLLDLHGFISVFAPITEPAVGYTQNGSWLAGGGYFGFWKDNSIRYRGVIGYGNLNLKFLRLGR